MAKREAPALKLTIEDGRLVPASAWDQERLMTYRNRSTVNAYVTQDKPRWMERKYWSILDRVITTCGIKQRTAEDLHDHIKLKLGFVNAKFDDNGKLKVTLKSTKLMEDPEYEGFFKEAMGYLFDLTGVDPMTLKKEAADVGADEIEGQSSEVAPALDGQGSDDTPPPGPVVAADPSEPVGPVEAGAIEADHPDTAVPASVIPSDEDRDWLKLVAKMLWAATGIGEQDVLKRQMAGIRENHTPATIGDHARAKANSINAKCKLVCFGEASAADVLPLIAGIAGCEIKDVTT